MRKGGDGTCPAGRPEAEVGVAATRAGAFRPSVMPRWAVLAVVVLGWGCTDQRHVLLVHSPLDREGLGWMERRFEAHHPGVDLRWIQVPAEETLSLLREGSAEEWPDVWWGAPSWILAAASRESRLTAVSPSWLDDVERGLRDPADRWIGVLLDPLVIAFDRRRVSLGRAPRDWIDLFHPRWAGEVVVPDAPATLAGSVLVGTLVGRDVAEGGDGTGGFDWLRRLDATVAEYPADEPTAVRRLTRGQETFAILRMSTAAQAAERSDDLAWRLPESGVPVLVGGVAVVAGAAAPIEAEALVEWLGSPEEAVTVASRFRRWTALRGRDETSASTPLTQAGAELRAWVADADTLAAYLDDWIERWRTDVREASLRVF